MGACIWPMAAVFWGKHWALDRASEKCPPFAHRPPNLRFADALGIRFARSYTLLTERKEEWSFIIGVSVYEAHADGGMFYVVLRTQAMRCQSITASVMFDC